MLMLSKAELVKREQEGKAGPKAPLLAPLDASDSLGEDRECVTEREDSLPNV